ncbi:MAG: Uma2 family endonuclease [Acidobacteria bacterium]|nr:Uma2 family endonuclease [Acidobacteriota bacterium]
MPSINFDRDAAPPAASDAVRRIRLAGVQTAFRRDRRRQRSQTHLHGSSPDDCSNLRTARTHCEYSSQFHNFCRHVPAKEIISTGSATLRSKRRNFGVEPDLSYFVSKADIHQTKATVEEEIDLAPDIVVEIDIHHKSDQKVEIYAEFGISEFWRYDGERLVISRLQPDGSYLAIPDSVEIPVLNAEVLSEFLARGQKEKQFVVLSDFQNWLGEKLGA